MSEELSNLPPQSYFDERDALALLVPRAKLLAALADAYGQTGATVPLAQQVQESVLLNPQQKPAAVLGPVLTPAERQAVEALCDVAEAALHVADDRPFADDTVPVGHRDMDTLVGAMDKLGSLTNGQPDLAMLPGGQARWTLRRLLDALPVQEVPAATPGNAVRSFRDYLGMHDGIKLGGHAMDDMALDLARIALDFKHLVSEPARAAVVGPMPADPTEEMLEVLMAGEDRLRAHHDDEQPKRRAKERYRALLALAAAPTTHAPAAGLPEDTFRGDTPSLVRNILALLELDAEGALVPHGVGGHARGLLSAAAARLQAERQAPAAPFGYAGRWPNTDADPSFYSREMVERHGDHMRPAGQILTPLYEWPVPAVPLESGPAGSGGWESHARQMERERDHWRDRARVMSEHKEGVVWYWQGDGEDHPESWVNTLPVVIRADELRALIGPAAPAAPAVDAIRQAVRDYHYALDARKHGGVAACNAIHAIEAALGMEWNQGAEAAARAPQAKEAAAP